MADDVMVDERPKTKGLDTLYTPKASIPPVEGADFFGATANNEQEPSASFGFANATIAHAKLHARMVKKTKKWTAIGAGGLILLLLIWPLTQSGKSSFKLDFASMEKHTSEIPSMKGPRLHGVDKDGQPFDITADEALQEKEGKVHLQNLNSDLSSKDGNWYSLLSPQADYVLKEKQLLLSGGVEVFTGTGYEVQTPNAQADLNRHLVYGKEGVVVQGAMGNLKAKRFELRQQSEQLYFDGRVMVIAIPGAK